MLQRRATRCCAKNCRCESSNVTSPSVKLNCVVVNLAYQDFFENSSVCYPNKRTTVAAFTLAILPLGKSLLAFLF